MNLRSFMVIFLLVQGGYAGAQTPDSTKRSFADTSKLDEVVIRTHQNSTQVSLMDALQTQRISGRELLKAACCNLGESFETTPSVDAAFTDAVTGYKQIQMLGLSGPNTLITRENIPDVRGLASVTGFTFTPGTWIEGMQLSKGTGSVVNGYEGVAGQINVELLKPFEGDRYLFNLYQNSQGRTEGNVVARKELNESLSTSLMLHGRTQWGRTDQNDDGFLDQPLGNQFVGLNRWFYAAPNGFELQLGVKFTYADNVGGQRGYNWGDEQVPGKPWGYRSTINRQEGWAKIGKVWADKKWRSVGLQLSAANHLQDAQYGLSTYNGKEQSFYSNLIYQSIIDNTNHIIKFGASFLSDKYDETYLVNSRYRRTENVAGAFAEYSWTPNKQWTVVAGLRGDYHNIFGAFATPRLHVRYAPFKKTAIRLSAGRAQRTANIFAENMGYMASMRSMYIMKKDPNDGLYHVNNDSSKPYGLNPEVSWNGGVNLTQKFRLNYRDASFTADYYYTHFDNQVVVDIENPHYVYFYNLDGRSYAHSLQFQLDYELIHNLDIRASYRWYDVRTTYLNAGNQLKERPLISAHRAFFNAGYKTASNWKFDYTIQWVSPKRVPASHDHNGGMGEEYYSPSYFQMSAQISKTWRNNIEVYLGGENLTGYMQHHAVLGADNPYDAGFDASLVWGPAMGRNIYAGIRYKIK